MKKCYKMAGTLLAGVCLVTQVNAQTHYGLGAGTQGIAHSFFGVDAGKVNTGSYSTFIGQGAGESNSTGTSNTFLGSYAGNVGNTTGSFNTFIGNVAGYNSNGNDNTFLGFAAGNQNKVGNDNTFIGVSAGNKNQGGNQNTFLGNRAGSADSHGNENVMAGFKSGYLSGGADTGNAFFGSWSGYESKGNYNCFFGFKAGYANTSGSNNTYLGYMSGGSATLVNATAIGANALVTASHSIALGNSAKVGIGYSAPSFQLHLSTDAAAKAGSPDWTVASDSRLKRNITDFTDGLDLLKQIRPVWFQYNGQAGIETGDKKFVGIIAQEMQKIAPYTIGTFTHQDSLGNKTEYLDYDANAVTYILINSVKEQQEVIEQKDLELKEMNAQVAALSKRLEQLERIVASNTAKPLTGSAARVEPNGTGVIVEQNVPNGFSESSAIRYFVPNSVKEARVDVYSVSGVKVNSYPVKERGEGQLTISADDFPNGVFLYDLVTDGKSNGVKKMVIQK
ncbi:Chaperone of endosialidase [Dyadobacter soli]|uniref:Chaperone of endosialidase n=1 Tax=Dyadobacter soli TaxID=659014 RepID=A0A1G7H1E5_9BACT|nr:tail fiber domain-containing protein [Dyadobacter soli]SDE94237.1 Chaperone of endosialidase [Dyadobacter soli]